MELLPLPYITCVVILIPFPELTCSWTGGPQRAGGIHTVRAHACGVSGHEPPGVVLDVTRRLTCGAILHELARACLSTAVATSVVDAVRSLGSVRLHAAFFSVLLITTRYPGMINTALTVGVAGIGPRCLFVFCFLFFVPRFPPTHV